MRSMLDVHTRLSSETRRALPDEKHGRPTAGACWGIDYWGEAWEDQESVLFRDVHAERAFGAIVRALLAMTGVREKRPHRPFGLPSLIDVWPGMRIGTWTCVQRRAARDGQQVWLVRCACGRGLEKAVANLKWHVARGTRTCCASCSQSARRARERDRREPAQPRDRNSSRSTAHA